MRFYTLILVLCSFWAPDLPAPDDRNQLELFSKDSQIIHLPPVGEEPLPIRDILTHMNPGRPDPASELQADFEALQGSELGWMLRDVGRDLGSGALTGEESGDVLVHKFFDEFVYLKFGVRVEGALRAVNMNAVMSPTDAVDRRLTYRCLCDVTLSEWLYPAGDGKLFRDLPGAGKAAAFYAFGEESRGLPTAGSQSDPDVIVMRHLPETADLQQFREAFALEIRRLPMILSNRMRERIGTQSFIDLANAWRQYHIAMHELVKGLPTESIDAAEETAKSLAEQRADSEVTDRSSSAWESRYIRHLEVEEFRILTAEVRNDPEFTTKLKGTSFKLFKPELQSNKLSWVGGPTEINGATVFYREVFRAAYRAAQSQPPEVAAAVKAEADNALGVESTIVDLDNGRYGLVWVKQGLTGIQRRRVANMLRELDTLRRLGESTPKLAKRYGGILDRITIFEQKGKTSSLFLRPFMKHSILKRLQGPITWYLRVFKAEDPNPENWGKCPISFLP